MQIKTLSAVLAGCLLSVICLPGSEMPSADPTDRLPTTGTLESVNFKEVAPVDNERAPYDEVCAARGLFVAYRGGADAVSKYREPVVTRGPQGVSVFKAVSPAVVVVIVGTVNNGDFDPEGMGTGVVVDARGYKIGRAHV